MTDEGMRLLPCPFCGGEGVLTRYTHSFPYEIRCKHCGASSARLRSQRGASEVWNRRSSHPEPQGEMPEPDVIQQAREAGDMAGTAVIKMLRAYDALASRLREAEAHVKELRGRFQLCNEERERQHTRAEAAERGKEGMVPAGCEILCATCRLPLVTENIKRCDSGGACPLKYMLSAPSPLRSGTSADIRASVKEMNDQVRKDAAMLSAAEEKK